MCIIFIACKFYACVHVYGCDRLKLCQNHLLSFMLSFLWIFKMVPLIEDSCMTLAQKMKDLADSGNSADVWRCVSMSVGICVSVCCMCLHGGCTTL